jgi:hypothetical protein
MSKTKHTRRHFLIVQAHMSHGYQMFDTLSGSFDDAGNITWAGIHPKTLRRPEDGDSYLEPVRIRIHGQQGGYSGIEDAAIYGNRVEIQCAYDGYNTEWQTQSIASAWKAIAAKLKKFEGLGAPVGYADTCIRLAAALGYELAYRENGETRIVDARNFRWWVELRADRAINVKPAEAAA